MSAPPSATYRLQLGPGFTFADAASLAPYLRELGVSHAYASPLLAARPGSSHGYDVTDPTRLNPELGGEEGFRSFSDALVRAGLGLLLDIVPNHMAASTDNPWWNDVLEYGGASPWAGFFDITWDPAWSPVGSRVLVASLGRPFGEALEAGELRLVRGDAGLAIDYWGTRFPLSPCSWAGVLATGLDDLEARLGSESAELQAFERVLEECRALETSRDVAGRRAAVEAVRRELLRLIAASEEIHSHVERAIERVNGGAGDGSLDELDRLLRAQSYRLAFWKSAREKLNYRRFFNINDLVGLRAERLEVFQATHAKVLELVREGRVQGLRVDHVDGLADPLAYLVRLREHLAPDHADCYLVVEKIVLGDETLPEDWPVAGTTGYEFAAAVTGLLVDPDGLAALSTLYERMRGRPSSFAALAYEKKRMIAGFLFPGELRHLEYRLARLAEQDRHACDVPLAELRRALIEVTAGLPVYRTYARGDRIGEVDRRRLAQAVEEARRRAPHLDAAALGFVARLLTLELPSTLGADERRDWIDFVQMWQQITGPVSAKGVEDTALYVYNRLTALNEVGADPGDGALGSADFHRFNLARQEHWPATMNATTTHDTKRSEDVRARLAVLSELPEQWAAHLALWRELNAPHLGRVGGESVPDPDVEQLIYQTLLGIWPLEPEPPEHLRERMQATMVKAGREARQRTSWLRPNEPYERAVAAFVDAVMEPGSRFLDDFAIFARRLAAHGARNSLATVLLKLASPGVPDLYRGTELWDFSLVDPDNRRPVDFEHRARVLEELRRGREEDGRALIARLTDSWRDGRIKLYLTWQGLELRRRRAELFAAGDYLPLLAGGPRADHLVAFARRHGDAWVVAAAPRLLARAGASDELLVPAEWWGESALELPQGAPSRWRDALGGGVIEGRLSLARLLATFPVALLESEP